MAKAREERLTFESVVAPMATSLRNRVDACHADVAAMKSAGFSTVLPPNHNSHNGTATTTTTTTKTTTTTTATSKQRKAMMSLSQAPFVPSGNAFAGAAAAADDALGEVEVLLHQAGRADTCLRLVGPASRAVEQLEAVVS